MPQSHRNLSRDPLFSRAAGDVENVMQIVTQELEANEPHVRVVRCTAYHYQIRYYQAQYVHCDQLLCDIWPTTQKMMVHVKPRTSIRTETWDCAGDVLEAVYAAITRLEAMNAAAVEPAADASDHIEIRPSRPAAAAADIKMRMRNGEIAIRLHFPGVGSTVLQLNEDMTQQFLDAAVRLHQQLSTR